MIIQQEDCDNWCVQERNFKGIRKSETVYFVIVTVDLKKTTDKVWLCESVGKLKEVGQLSIEKMNELIIHTIDDLQLHVCHLGKVPIRGFNQIYAMDLQALPGNPPSSFKDHRKAKNRYHSRYGEGWVEKLKSSTAM